MRGTRRWSVAVVMAVAAAVAPPAAAATGSEAAERVPGGPRITVTELTDRAGRPLVSALRINDRGQVLGVMETETGRRLVVLHRGRATPVTPEGVFPQVTGFSERGHVVGTVHDYSTHTSRAFSSLDGRLEWLTDPDQYPTSGAYAVNDRGQVLGYRYGDGAPSGLVVWQSGGAVPVPLPPSPAVGGDINNRGQVLAGSMLWQIGGTPIALGSLGGSAESTQGTDLNDRGQVAGQGWTADQAIHAFLWSDGQMTDLGTLGGRRSTTFRTPNDHARVLNDRGHMVGHSNTADGRDAAFLWRDGEMIELASPDHLYSWPTAINDRDQVVGYSTYGSHGDMAWLWQDGRTIDLVRLLGDGTGGAHDINNRGQIVGTYEGRAVMWTVGRAP